MMFNEMRRKDRQLETAEIDRILGEGEYGVLSLTGRNGYPHPIPMSYAYEAGVLWLHAATEGSKLDDLRADGRAAFCVVGETEVLPEKFSTRYESVIAYGEISEASGPDVKRGLMALVAKYSPGFMAEGEAYAERSMAKTAVLRLDVRHVTGKGRK